MDVNEIYEARCSIKAISEIKNKLIQNFEQCDKPEDDIYTLKIDGDQISVSFISIIAQSTPRIIKFADSTFGYEFLFSVNLDKDLQVEVFRFYLTNDGRLCSNADKSLFIGDFNSKENIELVLFKIVLAILNSEVYLPFA